MGWYWNWRASESSPAPDGLEYLPAVRLQPTGGGSYTLNGTTLTATVEMALANPGRTWLIGNEPDSPYQDNLEPAAYAEAYHDLYSVIKAADPTARIANGGIVEVTPARLFYLDRVLETYRSLYHTPMPVDVWNIHIYVIQERSCEAYPDDCWGAAIPPGIGWSEGELYTIDDNANLDVFKQMVLDFRAWMASRGYSDRPLLVTEFGVQQPADYGFPAARVNAYMNGAFDFLRVTTGANGYPADGHRLVQQWAWWSLQRPAEYLLSNGWLYEPGPPQRRTAIGDNYAAYTAQIEPTVNLFPVSIGAEPPSILSPVDPVTVTLSARIANDGETNYAGAFVARFYAGLLGDTSHQIGADQVVTDLGGCGRSKVISVTFPNVSPGSHPVYIVVDPINDVSEDNEADNALSGVVLVATRQAFLPMIARDF